MVEEKENLNEVVEEQPQQQEEASDTEVMMQLKKDLDEEKSKNAALAAEKKRVWDKVLNNSSKSANNEPVQKKVEECVKPFKDGSSKLWFTNRDDAVKILELEEATRRETGKSSFLVPCKFKDSNERIKAEKDAERTYQFFKQAVESTKNQKEYDRFLDEHIEEDRNAKEVN